MERKNISSGAPWESIAGYSRAVRIGSTIHVAGTTAVDQTGKIVDADPYAQTVYILQKIEAALKEAGAGLQNVVRTRMFVTDITDWKEIARAHGEIFGDIRPAATMVEVSALIDPEMRVEIEADAVCPA